MIRSQLNVILQDLKKKIVLLVGPRQAGKTTLAKEIATHYKKSIYLNYDHMPDRKVIEQQSWLSDNHLLILDELHKMPNWKNYLKGIYDTKSPDLHILVTGSARLDVYDKIGDSLAGRYFRHRLLPLSPSEMAQSSPNTASLTHFIERGGFPEPFFAQSDLEARRWRAQYTDSLLSTDIFEIETIHNLKGMRTVFELLRHRVGSPVSYQSLAEDVGVAPTTIKRYIEILAAVYVIFIITPFSKNIARSLLKEPKIYFFDTGLVEGAGPKIENLVAVSLLKSVYGRNDQLAEPCALHYIRTKDGQEIDFAVVNNSIVEHAIEVKVSDQTISKTLYNFKKQYGFDSIQLVQSIKNDYLDKGIKVLSVESYLKELFL